MTTTERLIDSSHNRLARELLRSAELDEAPDNTVAKVALALGLGSTAVVTTVTTGAAASTGVAAMGTASAVTAAGMLKVMAIVSLTCGTLSYGGVKLALKMSEKPAAVTQVAARPPAMRVAKPQLARARAVAARAPEVAVNVPAPPMGADSDGDTAARGQELTQTAGADETSVRETGAPSVGRQSNHSNNAWTAANSPQSLVERSAAMPTSPLPETRSAPPTAAFPSDDGRAGNMPAVVEKSLPAADLEREVAQLDHARAALAAGKPAIALREIDAYRAQTPRGMLAAESVVLRVKALLDMGLRTVAEREARPLLLSAPQSRHAERLREILSVSPSAP